MHHRHIQLFQQHPQLSGQHRGGAVKAVARLREHDHVGLVLSQDVEHVGDQGHVGDKLLGGDAADEPQDGPQAHKGVGGGHDGIGPTPAQGGGDLQVDEAGMIHEHQGRAVHLVQPGLHRTESHRQHQYPGRQGHDSPQRGHKLQRQPVFWPGPSHDGIEIGGFHPDLHSTNPFGIK